MRTLKDTQYLGTYDLLMLQIRIPLGRNLVGVVLEERFKYALEWVQEKRFWDANCKRYFVL